MAPNFSNQTGVLFECDDDIATAEIPKEVTRPSERKVEQVWRNIILMGYLHLAALYGAYLMFSFNTMIATALYSEYQYNLFSLHKSNLSNSKHQNIFNL